MSCCGIHPFTFGSRGWFKDMAAQHISIPKSFSKGDACEWFSRFEYVVVQIAGTMK